jgi:hypothetical protein
LKKHIESGGFGIWISCDNIEEGLPLDNIIVKVLKQIHPQIRIDSENEIWEYATMRQFFLLIDDINMSLDPIRILRRIISFLPPQSTKSGKQETRIPFTIISPVWPKYWDPISQEFQNNPQINLIQIGKFSTEEAESIILSASQKCDKHMTRLQANQIAKNLGFDPLLIGLFTHFLRPDYNYNSLLSNEVIDVFIQKKLSEIAQKSPSQFQIIEYHEVLSKICTEMLIKKQFFPTFHQIEFILSENPKYLQIFREVIADRILCSIENEKLVFRHDRIQFYLLTKSMLEIFRIW